MPAFPSVASSVRTNRYRCNNVEPMISYGLQEICRQVSYKPRPILRPYSILSSSSPSTAYASSFRTAPSPFPATGRFQSRVKNGQQRPSKKYSCFICEGEFTLPQMLSRHMKDVHYPKETCSYCQFFTFSRGRRYIYRQHVKKYHPEQDPEISLPEIRPQSSRDTKASSQSDVMGPKQAQCVRLLLHSLFSE